MSRQLKHTPKIAADLTLADFVVPASQRLEANGAKSVERVDIPPVMDRPLLVAVRLSVNS